MNIEELKRQFIENEILMLSINGAFQHSKIYKPSVSSEERNLFNVYIKDSLKKLKMEKSVKQTIIDFAKKISDEKKDILYKERFRIGISQKLINLYLKYRWALTWDKEEPQYCPIDSIISKELKSNYKFTESDSEEEYRNVIAKAKEQAEKEGLSIAQWELKTFNRRNA